MQIDLIAVGKSAPVWVQTGMEAYSQRLTPEFKFKLIEIPAVTRNKSISSSVAMGKEGEKMLAATAQGSQVVALDVLGKPWTSEYFADFLDDCRTDIKHLTFFIGGADGLSKSCLQRADKKLSLSSFTFPHMLVRVILAEQLYRGLSILRNHPYHRM